MYVFLLIDYLTSLAISMSISLGSWMVYKSANGVYYSVKWLVGGTPKPITEKEMDDLKPVVVLTEEEYNNLISNQKGLIEIKSRLENIEHRLEHQ